MLQNHARRWLVLSLASVLLDGNVLVAGQDQQGRLDILTGTKSQSSCTLRDTIHSTCNLVVAPPPLTSNPIPSLCTCNKVYFNIWSACSYATGNNTLPVFSNWTQMCTSSNVDLLSSEATANNEGLGIDIPPWGLMDVPGNQTIDIQRAVILANTTKHWSILQILAPIISGIVAVLMTFILIFYCRPRIGQTNLRGRMHDLFRPVPRMRPVEQPMQWGIDEDVHGPSGIPPPMVDPRSPIETTHHTTNLSIQGNPSAPPSRYDDLVGQTMDPIRSTIPGGRTYPFAPTYGPSNPQPSQPTPGQSSTGSSLLNRIPNFQLPWKPKPPHVKIVQPGPRFKVDHREQSLQSIESADSTQSSFTSWGPERPRGSFDVHEHEDDEDEMIMESNTDYPGSEHEGTSLISEEQRRSMLTSQAHSSSINSHVRVVPPSNSSSSPRDSRPGSIPFVFARRNPPPVVPPPPTQPAPPVPFSNKTFRREGPLASSLAQLPSDRLMATIQENDRRTPSPIPAQSTLHRPRPSIDNPRPLPQPGNAPAPPHPDVLSAHQRSDSQTGSASSVYEESSMAGYTASGESHPTPSRSGSADSQISSFQPRSAFSRPLPSTHANNIPLSNLGSQQNNYPPTHQRSASGSSSSAANVYHDPFAPSVGHGRGPDWDDDGASFYLEAVEPPRLVRSPSPTLMPGDTALLFHPSVRGAGYKGRPN